MISSYIFVMLSITASSVLSCSLTSEFSGVNTELKLSKLEATVKSLSQKLALAEAKLIQVEAAQAVTDKVTKDCIRQNAKHWSFKRLNSIFHGLQKIRLHQQTPTYVERLPYNVPSDTKALMISIFCNFWNVRGHAYLNADIYQKGNEDSGIAKIVNTHYNVYANTFYYEIMLPWDAKLSNELVFKVTSTYQTGGGANWYQVKLVGYITD